MNQRFKLSYGVFLHMLIILALLYQTRLNVNLSKRMLELTNSLRRTDSYNPFLHKQSPPLLASISKTKSDGQKVNSYIRYNKHRLDELLVKDWNEISPALWDFMLGPLAVKSFIDIGCGRGYTSKYFLDNGARVICVEGSHDAVTQSVVPGRVIREHDFTRGQWWPDETFDVAWSVEFVEHVGRQYMPNYFPIFKMSALIMVLA